MDIEIAKFGFQVLQFLLWAATSFYVYMSNKDKVTNDRIAKMEQEFDSKLDGHTERIAKMEARAEKSPTHKDMADLHERINGVFGELKELRGEFSGTNKTLQLIHETMMERK